MPLATSALPRFFRTSSLIVLAMGMISSVDAQPVDTVATTPIRNREVLTQIAQRLERDLHGKPDRLALYVDSFARELGNDSRLFAFDVDADVSGDGRVQLNGFVEFPETRQALVTYLHMLGFQVDDHLETLPTVPLGARNLGVIKSSNSLSYDRSEEPRSVVTDCLMGEPLFLLREANGHILVHSGEGYVGYVPATDIVRFDGPEFDAYLNTANVRVVTDFRTPQGRLIPKGARLKFVGSDGTVTMCQLPSGELVGIPNHSCRRQEDPEELIDKICSSAEELLKTPYLWGGKSSAGVDCSGLVQVGFATAGLFLPRDSNQQILIGQLTATRWHRTGMQRGDTLYFIGEHGKIRHTALYLGNDRFVHAVTPVVRINSFNPAHPDFDPVRAASFAFAKRLLE